MKVNGEIIERLLEIMKEKGLSGAEFSRALSYESNKISEIVNGHTKELSGRFVRLMELEFHINPKWLETGIGKKYIAHQSVTDPKILKLLKSIYSLNSRYLDRAIGLVDTFYLEQEVHAGRLYVAERKHSYGPGKKKDERKGQEKRE